MARKKSPTARKSARKPAPATTRRKAPAKRPPAPKSVKKTAERKAAPRPVRKKTARKVVAKKEALRERIVKKGPRRAAVKKVAKKAVAKTPRKIVRKRPAAPAPTPRKAPVPTAAPAPAQVPAPPVREVSRRAYGSYNGVVVCENPGVFPDKSPYSAKELEMLRKILSDERTRMREVLRNMDDAVLRLTAEKSDKESPGYSIHLAETATDSIDTETAFLLRREQEEALKQVEAALERLDNGLYGACMACGDKIGIARLRVLPEAHLCMKCQEVYDKRSGRR